MSRVYRLALLVCLAALIGCAKKLEQRAVVTGHFLDMKDHDDSDPYTALQTARDEVFYVWGTLGTVGDTVVVSYDSQYGWTQWKPR